MTALQQPDDPSRPCTVRRHSYGCSFGSSSKDELKSRQTQLPRTEPNGRPFESSHLAAEPLPHVLGNRHRLQRARIACLLRPDAGFAASAATAPEASRKTWLMVKELRPKREMWLSTTSFSPVCEARLKEHWRRPAACPPSTARCACRCASTPQQEQPMARLVAPAEVGRVVDDAGGVAVAPLDRHLVTATQRHGAAIERQRRWPPRSWIAYRPPDRPGPRHARCRRRRPRRAASCGAPGRARSPRR